jgi:sialidase-1
MSGSAVTCMAWIRLDASPDKWANVIRKTWKNNSGPSSASYALQLNPNGNAPTLLAFVTGFSNGNDILISPSGAIVTGAWLHLAGAYDPSGASPQKRLYVNGKRVVERGLTRPLAYDTTITGDLYFGQNGRGDERFKGLVDDVRIYGRALSDKEVLAMYEGRTP